MSDIIKNQDTRREFIDTLCELAEKDETICLIVCDVGFNYIDKFRDKFPKRFFNFGVTEQSSMVIAAGMAIAGLKPYFYSMINFSVFRPFEMIRNMVHFHKANVKILGVKGSSHYKMLGFSHNMAFEDEDIYHLKSYMDCYVTKTPEETRKAVLESYEKNKSAYIRL